MKLIPINDRIIVKRVIPKQKKDSLIIIPEGVQEKPQLAEIIAVGKGRHQDDGAHVPMQVTSGQRILFGKYSGTEMEVDGQTYIILSEDEVLCVVEDKKGNK